MEDSLVDEEKEDPKGCSASLACNPLRGLHRYLMLFFICFLSFGNYFCYDGPAALQDVILRSLKITKVEFMNLYAFYSWPNVIMSFVGGVLIDKIFGIPLGAILFSGFVLMGQLVFGMGAYFNCLPVMYFARLVFGIGGESLAVAQNAYTTYWFPPNELNFVFGLQLSMSRVGSTINMVSMHKINAEVGNHFSISGYHQLGASLFIAAVTCLFSAICALVLAYFTRRAKRIRDAYEIQLEAESTSPPKEPVPNQEISVRAIVHFPSAIWLICIICVAYYVTVFPFVSLGLVFFERKFNLPVHEASVVNSLVYIVSAVASPLFGAAIDFTGRNLNWVLSGILITLSCHLLFAFTFGSFPPMVIMVVMGLSYSVLASSLWPLVAYLLPVTQRGTAYGLIQSVQNLGLGLVSIFAGYLVDTKGYLFLEVFFQLCLSVAVATTFGLYIWDQSHGHVLNESGKSRRSKAKACSVKDTYFASNTIDYD